MSCTAEMEHEAQGILHLTLAPAQEFVEISTRGGIVEDLSSFSFTLGGTSHAGAEPLYINEGKAILPAGTYTLFATNAAVVDNGYGGALYSGSTEFEIVAGAVTPLTLQLGAPQNAKVSLQVDASFSALYDLSSVSLSDGVRTVSLFEAETADPAFFPIPASGQLSYTIAASANAGSHAQEYQHTHGTIAIASGRHTLIRLAANPISGYITIDTGTPHSGAFD